MELDLSNFEKTETDNTSLKEKFLKNKFSLAFGFIGLLLIVGGLIVIVQSNQTEDKIEIIPAQEEKAVEKIKADIEGAVIKPGLYELDSGSRLNDLLITAGGLSAQADRVWVDKSLNKAQKLKDGDKIFIPEKQEANISVSSGNQGTVTNTPVLGTTSASTININTASLAELDTLYGVGPVTAQKIVDNRPYKAIEDLLNKKVVNRSVFGKIQDKISVY